ncbi:MAG: flagellar protein FlaG [Xanthobacteraceae bacterium]|jgi:uncharacterized FlaG/YvyC family protein
MDSGLTIRPIGQVTQPGPARPDPPPIAHAVATTLAASQSVTAVADSAASRNNAEHQPQYAENQSRRSREIVIDAATRDIIYRVINERSGQVVQQIPEEVILRLRAYVRELRERESRDKAAHNADFAA